MAFAVEYGFLSTTASLDVAFQYSGAQKNRGMIFEITAGRIDIGASIQVNSLLRQVRRTYVARIALCFKIMGIWQLFSQYPDEEEFLMPPLSSIEVADYSFLFVCADCVFFALILISRVCASQFKFVFGPSILDQTALKAYCQSVSILGRP